MTTLEKLRALVAANSLLLGLVFGTLGIALAAAISTKKIWRVSSPRTQFDSPVMNPNTARAPMPIRIAFIALLFAFLGLLLFVVFGDGFYFPTPNWLDRWGKRVFFSMLAILFLASCLLIKRERELARCGFAVVILVILYPLFSPA